MKKQYDPSIDLFKGILTIFMVITHTILLMTDITKSHFNQMAVNVLILLIFSSYLFCFGQTIYLAYLQKTCSIVRMLRTTFRLYGVYILSGIFALIFYDKIPFTFERLFSLLSLQLLAPYSEFLLAFSLYTLFALLFFSSLQKSGKAKHPLFLYGLIFLSLFVYWILPMKERPVWLGILIGMQKPASYPVLPYFCLFLLGILWQCQPQNRKYYTIAGAIITLLCSLYCIYIHALPQRFPVTLWWVLLPVGCIIALQWLCMFLTRYKGLYIVRKIGRKSLWLLLFSNIILFILHNYTLPPYLGWGVGLLLIYVGYMILLFYEKMRKRLFVHFR